MNYLTYALELAWHRLWRSPYITVLGILTLALGMGTTITAYSVIRLVGGNPLPSRSDTLYQVVIDPDGLNTLHVGRSMYGNNNVTLLDARQLEAAAPTIMQTALINLDARFLWGRVDRSDGRRVARHLHGLEVQSDFFAMFDVPMVAGHGWSHADDASAAPVAAISQRVARKLFGGGKAAVGQVVTISGHSFRIVGVTGHWVINPHFYGLTYCTYACKAEEVFLPISAARAARMILFRTVRTNAPGENGTAWCFQGPHGVSADRCPYLDFWALFPTTAQRIAYRTMLAHYASAQKEAGRLALGGMAATALYSIRDVLDAYHVVPFSARFGIRVAVVFLLICLVSVAGLLLTRTMRATVELGVRRALGATRGAIFAQCLIEGGLVGLFGGVVALPLVWLGLWLVHQEPTAYASVVGFHLPSMVMLLVLAIACGALTGAVPAWRAATVDAGLQVKEQ